MFSAVMFRNIFSRGKLIKYLGLSNKKSYNYRFSQVQFASTDKTAKTDKPIKYSTSKAGEWKAMYTFYGEDVDKVPEAQFYSVFISLSVFLLYFLYLREENDLDDYIRELERDTPIKLAKAVERTAKNSSVNQIPSAVLYQQKLRKMEELKEKLQSK